MRRTRIERGFSGFLIVAKGVELVCDFGRIFHKIVRPYVDEEDNTLDEAVNRSGPLCQYQVGKKHSC